ncbi:MAG TPA: zf-HC2 domain-containing protein [Gaiellaceae bacterium]|nr:zf-HC2 domain-containing protein [Gaiellaceae bacterium]
MRAAHCDRARFWISLQLDGVLSEFESALLEQHVGRCADCHAFKSDAIRQTRLLRDASLDRVTVAVDLPARPQPLRHVFAGLGTLAASAAAAVISLHLVAGSHPARPTASGEAAAHPAALAVLVVDAGTLGVRRGGERTPPAPDGSVVRGTFGLPA